MNHYIWLEKNLPIFFNNLNIDICCKSIIASDGDKCYSAKNLFEKHEIHFYHGYAIYLISKIEPFCNEVRNTQTGWVDPFEWIVNNKERFISHLPKIE